MIVQTSTTQILDSLSYSEMKAVEALSGKLQDDGNVSLVSSVIADETGVSRSMLVNVLTKLSAAGVIQTRSLGMKGTMIRVLNRKAFDMIVKELAI